MTLSDKIKKKCSCGCGHSIIYVGDVKEFIKKLKEEFKEYDFGLIDKLAGDDLI